MNDKDIKILEEHAQYFLNQEDRQALMNVLERLQELQKQINGAFDRDFIPVAKIKEKIKELEKEYNEILADYGNIDTDVIINIPNENVRKYLEKLADKIITLQELLEEK